MLQNPESSLSAAAALGVWGSPRALPGLLDAYKQADAQKDLRLEILDAFSRIEDPRIGPLLQKIVQVDPDPLARDKAARLFGGQVRRRRGPGRRRARVRAPSISPRIRSPTLDELLRHARAVQASDLHLSTGTVPQMRVHGRLGPLPLPPSTPEQMEAWLSPMLQDGRAEQLAERRQLDFCHKDADLGRFRTNVFFQRKGAAAVMRLVPFEIPNLAGHRAAGERLGDHELLAGARPRDRAGRLRQDDDARGARRPHQRDASAATSSRSRTRSSTCTRNKESLVNQREIPTHSPSFAKALRQSLREDPDVILVGEMRDLETISLAITASETGHLVLATLHTTTASSTVDRIINAFPPDQQGQIRMMVADSLEGRHLPVAPAAPRRRRPRRGVRDPPQHAERRRPDPRRQDVPAPDRRCRRAARPA